MRKSIATVSLSGTLEEKLAAVARAGFDGVEIFENDLINSPARPAQVRRWADDLGLSIDLYQPFRDLETVGDAQFRRNLDRAERKLEVMEALGAPTLLVCSSVADTAVGDDAAAAAQLRTLADRAAQRGLRVAYEALAWGRHVHDYRRAAAIVAAAEHPHLGVCLDSFHILSRGDDPAAIAGIPGEKIFYLQLADAPRLVMDVVQWSRHYRCFPGQGGFDLASFVELVVAAGYRGPLSLEVFNDTFRQADASRTAVDAMRSLLWLEESLRGRLASTSRGDMTTQSGDEAADRLAGPAAGVVGPSSALRDDPTTEGADGAADLGTRTPREPRERARARARERIELFDPPAAPALGGLEFVELAAGGDLAAAAEQLLTQLGFERAGRHRTKPVTLWQQGDVRVLLNASGVLVSTDGDRGDQGGSGGLGDRGDQGVSGEGGRGGPGDRGGRGAPGGSRDHGDQDQGNRADRGGLGDRGGSRGRGGGGGHAWASPELAALGVRTSDADRSANRAEAFRAPVVPRRRGPGEADLPAVRATDGTAVLFCGDASWLDDFRLANRAPAGEPGGGQGQQGGGDRAGGEDPRGGGAQPDGGARVDGGAQVDRGTQVDGGVAAADRGQAAHPGVGGPGGRVEEAGRPGRGAAGDRPEGRDRGGPSAGLGPSGRGPAGDYPELRGRGALRAPGDPPAGPPPGSEPSGRGAAAGAPPRTRPLLTRIDHVNLSVPFDQFDEAILFLRSVLGLQPRENLELADPYGLVRSRALADRGETVRVALNVLQLRGRAAGAAAPERRLQHVAFGCDDIFATARALRAAGLRCLPVSDNYYDDLAARFDLPDDRLAALRDLGILYDRSPAGEYFHVYTEMLGHHLFFEIVQRAGDDRGFGASNAPVRMAAQRAAAHQ